MLQEKNKYLTTTLATVSNANVPKLALVQDSNPAKTRQRRFTDTAYISPVVKEKLPAVAVQSTSDSDLSKQHKKHSLQNETSSEIRRTDYGRKERRKSEILRPVNEFVEPLHSSRNGFEQQLKQTNERFTREKTWHGASKTRSESHEKQRQLATSDARCSLEESENYFSEQRLTPMQTGTTRLLPKRKLSVWKNDFNAEGRIPATREIRASQHAKSIQPLNGVHETSRGQVNQLGSYHDVKIDRQDQKSFEKKNEQPAHEIQGKDEASNSSDMFQRMKKGRSSRAEINDLCSSNSASQPRRCEELISAATSPREDWSLGIDKRQSLDEGLGRRKTLKPITEHSRRLSFQQIGGSSNEKSNKQIINEDSSLTNSVGVPRKECTGRGKLGSLLPSEAQIRRSCDDTNNCQNDENDGIKCPLDMNNNIVTKGSNPTFPSQNKTMAGVNVDDTIPKHNAVGKENASKSILHSKSETTNTRSKEIDQTIKKTRSNEVKHIRRSHSASGLQERNMRAAIEEARTGKKKRQFSIRQTLQRKVPEDKEECYSDNESWNEKKIRIIMKRVELVGIMKRKGNVNRKRVSFDKKVKKIYIFCK